MKNEKYKTKRPTIAEMAQKVDWWAETEEPNDNKLTSKGKK